MTIESLIANGATIVDVRTPAEYQMGNVPGSLNIPLNEVAARMSEIVALEGPLVLCCASGGRSGQACAFLEQYGVECYNAGSWLNINRIKAMV